MDDGSGPSGPIPIEHFFPKEGREVLAWNGKYWSICMFDQNHRFIGTFAEVPGVTHWLPLPEPPNTEPHKPIQSWIQKTQP